MPAKADSATIRRLGTPLLCGLSVLLLVVGSLGSLRAAMSVLPDELFPLLRTSEESASTSLPIPNSLQSCNCSGTIATNASEVWHSMEDEELLRCAAVRPRGYWPRPDRVAFMFLTRGRLPLRLLWEKFFKGHKSRFSVYHHTPPEFREELPEESAFFRRRIPSKAVEWGRPTMIDAERRLLANALLDPSNAWFVLLSESCIPLFNFTVVHGYLLNSTLTFVGSFDDPRTVGRGRYNKRMFPTVTLPDWRKGSQWFAVDRNLATEIVADNIYYTVFKEHCRPPCYMDEHYVPTLVNKLFARLNSNRSLTWVDWSRGGSHPKTFRHRDVSVWLLERLRHGSKCEYNGGVSMICYLFARKFDASTLGPLLHIAPKMLGFDDEL